jgi:uncharacterized RDD family membrane protein YckC
MTIHTPEGLTFALRLGGPLVRLLAFLVDLMCIAVLTRVITALFGLVGLISADVYTALSILTYFAVSMGYGMVLEWLWHGQTVGKRLLNLRDMDAQGLSLRFDQVALRNLLRLVDILPAFYLLGGLFMLISPVYQRLGDLAAGTIVVWTPDTPQPDLSQLFTGKFNSFRAHPHLCARLRQKTTPAEADLALSALLRRESLDPQARITLFAAIAAHFRNHVTFPDDALIGLSDEQITRNLVEILFRSDASPRKKTP